MHLHKDRYNPWGLPLPKAADLPCFQGPLSDADSVLTHLHRLQQVLCTHALLTPSDDMEVEEKCWMTVIELANNSIECENDDMGGMVRCLQGQGYACSLGVSNLAHSLSSLFL